MAPHARDKYEMLHKVGQGAYGEVWKAVIKETGKEVAIKDIKLQKRTDGVERSAIDEIRLMQVCSRAFAYARECGVWMCVCACVCLGGCVASKFSRTQTSTRNHSYTRRESAHVRESERERERARERERERETERGREILSVFVCVCVCVHVCVHIWCLLFMHACIYTLFPSPILASVCDVSYDLSLSLPRILSLALSLSLFLSLSLSL